MYVGREEDNDRLMDIFEERISNSVSPSCEIPKKYEPPSDEITSREA